VKPCPECGVTGAISVAPGVVALPLATWSVSGAMPKVSAWSGAVLACSACKMRVVGHLVNATVDAAGVLTGGHFVSGPPPS
jgi:hypothetical protein